ncbi:hypothetical protein LEMLEM_LOCUS921 [Lemmus lemmus]
MCWYYRCQNMKGLLLNLEELAFSAGLSDSKSLGLACLCVPSTEVTDFTI